MKTIYPCKRWLVVDDDLTIRKLAAMVLQTRPGIEVVVCDNPQDAMTTFISAPKSFEVLITDFEMPIFNGLELARKVRAQSSEIRILLISGNGVEASELRCSALDGFLPKPFTPGELMEAVEAILLNLSTPSSLGTEVATPEALASISS